MLAAAILTAVREGLAAEPQPKLKGREWLSREEAADHLGVSVATIDRMAKRGRISPSYSTGRRPLYRRAELDARRGDGGGEAPTTPPRHREE
jgi:excisionase family DNA binding protein